LTRKGRPNGSKAVPKQSTTRHPSHFELVDTDLANSNKRQRRRSPSPKPSEFPEPPTYQFSAETLAILTEIRSRKPEATPDPETDQEMIPSPIVIDNPSPRERALMELKRQRIFGARRNNTTPPPPLWATISEFAGMTRAATAARPTTPRQGVSIDLPVRRSPARRPPPLARRSPLTTWPGRTSKPTGRMAEAQARARARADRDAEREAQLRAEANDQSEGE
jgi:hypothetical protein